MNKSEQINELAKALSQAQSEMRGAVKDAQNPFFKSRYSDLESCWDAAREPLTKNGLSVSQTMGFKAECGPTLITTLLHTSGQWIEGEQPVFPKSQAPQEMGSAITYSRRYGFAAIVGLYQTDDDAETAHGRPSQPSNKPTPIRPQGPTPIGSRPPQKF